MQVPPVAVCRPTFVDVVKRAKPAGGLAVGAGGDGKPVQQEGAAIEKGTGIGVEVVCSEEFTDMVHVKLLSRCHTG